MFPPEVEVIYTLLCGDVGALATEHPEPAPGKRLDLPACQKSTAVWFQF